MFSIIFTVCKGRISILAILLSAIPGKRIGSPSNSLFKYLDFFRNSSFLASKSCFEK